MNNDNERKYASLMRSELSRIYNVPFRYCINNEFYMSMYPEALVVTINAVRGCSRKSRACANCYAECGTGKMILNPTAKRAAKAWLAVSKKADNPAIKTRVWNGESNYLREELLELVSFLQVATARGKTVVVIYCSSGDLCFEKHSIRAIYDHLELVQEFPEHKFMILTKRPEILKRRISEIFNDNVMDNLIIGTTAEDQKMADLRLPILMDTPAGKHIASLSPLMSDIKFSTSWLRSLDFVTCKGEYGVVKRIQPTHPDWLRSVRDQVLSYEIPFLFENWGTRLRCVPDTGGAFRLQIEAGLRTDMLRGGSWLDGHLYKGMVGWGGPVVNYEREYEVAYERLISAGVFK